MTLLFVGAFTILATLARMPTDSLLDPSFRVRLEQDSLAFFGPNLTSAVFWVTPAEDIVYTPEASSRLIGREAFAVHSSALGEMLIESQHLLFGRDLLAWHVEDQAHPNRSVTYVVAKERPGWVRVSRTIEGLPASAYAVGQVVRYCDTCRIEQSDTDDQSSVVIFDPEGGHTAAIVTPPKAHIDISTADHIVEMRTAAAADLWQEVHFLYQ